MNTYQFMFQNWKYCGKYLVNSSAEDNMEFASLECLIKCSYSKIMFSRPSLHLPYSVDLPSVKLTTDTREGLQTHQAASDHLQQAGHLASMVPKV